LGDLGYREKNVRTRRNDLDSFCWISGPVAEYCEQFSEAFGSRNDGMMSQTIINISRRILLHRVKRYRWLNKDIFLKCQYSIMFLLVTYFSAL
jgi:hypothetical protein